MEGRGNKEEDKKGAVEHLSIFIGVMRQQDLLQSGGS